MTNEFIDVSRSLLRTDFLPRLEAAVKQLSEDDIWWRPNEASNSIGNLILHLCGNMRQWIVEGLGGIPTHRDRDGEFAAKGPMPKAALLARLEDALAEVEGVLKGFDANRLLERKSIQIYEVSALHAIYHVVEHFSYHMGQILYIYKLRTGRDLKFYEDLEPK
jgi:uncharacterized damage-inducible protein DinB